MRKAMWLLVLSSIFWCNPAGARAKHGIRIMEATAFTHARQTTAAGTAAREGIVAADPFVLPLGTRIRITGADAYDGNYLVTDTGAGVKGRHIDLYVASRAEAKEFGKKTVRVQVLRWGNGKTDARDRDDASLPRRPGGGHARSAYR